MSRCWLAAPRTYNARWLSGERAGALSSPGKREREGKKGIRRAEYYTHQRGNNYLYLAGLVWPDFGAFQGRKNFRVSMHPM